MAKTLFEVRVGARRDGLYDSVAKRYVTKRRASKDVLRKYVAWSLNQKVFEELKAKGCLWWVVHEVEHNIISHLNLLNVPGLGRLEDLGKGSQYFVQLGSFTPGMPPQ